MTYDRTVDNNLAATNYTLYPVPANSTVTVTFPTQYVITTNITCKYQINSTGSFLVNSCTFSGNLITLTGVFSSSTILANLILVVAGVQNPYPAVTTAAFTGTIGSDVAVTRNFKSIVTLTAATFASCGFTFTPNYVDSTESMIFTVTTTNPIPSAGSIKLTFPLTKLWSNELDTSRIMPISSSMTCNQNSTNVNAAIQCTGSSNIVNITNIFSTSIASGTLFSFTILNFYSPPTNQPADAITITSYINGSAIDTCSSYVSGLLPIVIQNSSYLITTDSGNKMTVNQIYTIRFAFTTTNLMSSSDYFTITFPTGSTIDLSLSAIGSTIGVNPTNATFINSILTLYLSGVSGAISPQTIFITLSNFRAPLSTLPTGNFVFQVVASGYPRMIGYQNLVALVNSLTATVARNSTTVNVLTTLTFSITSTDGLNSDGKLKIIFPSVFVLPTAASCALITGSGFASTPICTYNLIENSVTLSSINSSSSTIPGQIYTLAINGVKNPPSTATSGGWTISTYYNSGDNTLVASGSVAGVVSTAATVDYTGVTISASSQITSDSAVSYYLSFIVQNPIPIGGYIVLYFPSDISFNTAVAASNCKVAINNGASSSTPCSGLLSGTSYIFNFTSPFSIVGASLNDNVTLSIVSSATNPISTKPVSPFSIYTYSSDTSLIASLLNSLTFSITQPCPFLINQYSRLSNKNGDTTQYSVNLKQSADL